MATAHFPHHYRVSLDGDGALSAGGLPTIAGGAPLQIGGVGDRWSPEELLVAAASLCFSTTFQSLARRQELPFAHFHCDGEGTVDKTKAGLVFTAIRLSVKLSVRHRDEDRARSLLVNAKRYCIVSNSLHCPVELDGRVEVQPDERVEAFH